MTGRAHDEPADLALVRLFLDGDEQAFRTLYRRHNGRVRMMVLRLLGQRGAEAEDALQEAWLAACRALPQYRGDAQLSTWLIAIAVRVARRHLHFAVSLEQEAQDDLPATSRDRPLEAIDLERALSRLPDAQRAVVVLHDVEGFTHEEISRTLGIAAGSSRSLLSRGRSALRKLLSGVTT